MKTEGNKKQRQKNKDQKLQIKKITRNIENRKKNRITLQKNEYRKVRVSIKINKIYLNQSEIAHTH